MKDDSFLKKFEGRTEQIGRNGYADIMNNVHINIVDYIPKPKKIKKPKVKVDKYGHIKSEVIEEFNKNINFISQTKNISTSVKKNKKDEVEKINDNSIKNNIANNIHKFNTKNNLENNKIKVKEKEKERPIKLLKNIKFNIINNNNEKSNPRLIQSSNIKNIGNNNINQKRISRQENNKNINNNLITPKTRSNSIKLNLKLPKISPQQSSPKKNTNNILINKTNTKKPNKNHERTNTYTPTFNNVEKSNLKIFKDNINASKNKRMNTENNNFKNYVIKKDYNFPKIEIKTNKSTNVENDKNIKIYNKQKDLILSNIKNDFLMLDSIKNRTNNIAKSQILEEKNNYQLNNNKIYNYFNNKDSNKQSFDYSKKVNDSKDIKKQNDLNINLSRNYYQDNMGDLNQKNNFGINDDNKPHTSFDTPKNIPKLKNKLDIIHEESEDDNKYITEVKFNNSFENYEKLNSLEILMKQRAHFQNKIPKDSRFKLK